MRLSIIITALAMALCCLACKKSAAPQLAKSTLPTGPDPVTVVTYPYTDTFCGVLTISKYYYGHTGGTIKKDSPYLFFVRHENADSIVIVSRDTIVNFRVMRRYFNYGYRTVGDGIYHFNNYVSITVSPFPVQPIDSFGTIHVLGLSLGVEWHDLHWDELRLREPTGGTEYDEYECSFLGYLVRH